MLSDRLLPLQKATAGFAMHCFFGQSLEADYLCFGYLAARKRVLEPSDPRFAPPPAAFISRPFQGLFWGMVCIAFFRAIYAFGFAGEVAYALTQRESPALLEGKKALLQATSKAEGIN